MLFRSITLLALLPWTVLLLPAAQEGLRLWREKSWADSPGFFFACWAIFPIIFFSASQSKLPGYILPAIPALALICSVGAIRAFQKSRLISVLVTVGLGLVWVTLAVLIFIQALRIPSTDMGRFVPLFLTEAAIVVAILLALAILVAGIFRNLSTAAIICSLSVVAILVLANIVVLPAADPFLSARPDAAFLRHDLRPDRIFTFELNRSWSYGLAFYFRRELPEWSAQDPEAALVLTTRKGLQEIEKAGRLQGDLNETEEGIFYVPVGPMPR